MVGLALEGGGAKGAYQIGSYVALKKYLKKIDMIVGTSIGALNAALLVQGDVKKAIDIWTSVDASVFGIDIDILKELKKEFSLKNIKAGLKEFKKVLNNKGIDVSGLKKIIDENINEDKIRNSSIKFGLVTIRLSDLKPLELTINDIPKGKLKEYLLASCYLPVFKNEKIIDDKFYLDGGFYNNLPISILENSGCDKIYAIRLKSIGRIKKYQSEIIEIKPNKSTGPVILFDQEDVQNNIKMGYFDTLKKLNKVLGKIYYFKKKRFYFVNTNVVDEKTLNIIKMKFNSNNYKEILYLAIEEILFYNKLDVLCVYEINKTLKFIKKNKLKCRSSVINDFIMNVRCILG